MSKTNTDARRTVKIGNRAFYLNADALERFEIVWVPSNAKAARSERGTLLGQLDLQGHCSCGAGMYDNCDLSRDGGSLRCNGCGQDHEIK